MPAVFVRRFDFDPGTQVLTNIESVNILDLTPPGSIRGIGSGTALLVGEFENGAYNAPWEVTSGPDIAATAGTLGYTYAGVVGQYPCAVSRKADGAINAELWNGNGFVHLNGKQFARLLLCRVDTSVGAIQFTRLGAITGAAAFDYAIANGLVLQLDLGVNGPSSATFTSTAATVTAIGGAYPTGFVGGETLTLGYDTAQNFTVTFLAGDTSIVNIIARINLYAGFTFADNNAGQIRLTGLQKGNGAQVRVVSGSAGVTAALGLTVANTSGTGNVADSLHVTFSEVKTIVEAGIAGALVEKDSSGAIRISNNANGATGAITVGASTTATSLGFTVGQQGSATGLATLTSGAGTYNTGFGGTETLTLGFDDSQNFVVSFTNGDQTIAQVVSRIQAAAATAGFPVGQTFCDNPTNTRLRFTGAKQGGQVRVVGASAGGVLTTLGLVAATTQVGTAQVDGVIPAGTRVQVPAGTLYVTTQDVTVTAVAHTGTPSGAGPYTTRLRHATDDGTGTGNNAGTITKVVVPIDLASFSSTNPQPTTNALTEAQIDAAYTNALNSTLDISDIASQANLLWCARQSNSIRRAIKNNATLASQSLQGRIGFVRPPLGTLKSLAQSAVAEPGVGSYRSKRVVYNYPGANTTVPLIGQRGLSGGVGFTADGSVDVGSDGFCVSVCSQLPPEENPGQETGFTGGANSLEKSPNAQGFQMADYINFKAAGICAPRFDGGVMSFQSGVTSVDPLVYPQLVNIARQRMADFLEDSIAAFSKGYGKKLSTRMRRKALASQIRVFLRLLLSPNQPSNQRIGGFKVDDKTGNTPQLLQQGLFRITTNVQTLPSLDSIVLAFTIGEDVFDVSEVLPQAA